LWLIPENVILRRWRRRPAREGCHAGVRLPPQVWQTINALRDAGTDAWRIGPEAIRTALASLQAAHPGRHFRCPSSSAFLNALARLHQQGALERILQRHRTECARREAPGVPDLLLWRERVDGAIEAIKFVEVKRPNERIARHQQEELSFLRSCGVKAGVVRLLCERPRRRHSRATRASS
jgi:hypothetical protein